MAITFSKLQTGLTIVELMIAVVLASLLVLGLTQVFSASRAAYQTSLGLSRVQESGRAAMEFIQRDLRMAGHMGCIADVARFFNEQPDAPALDSLFAATTTSGTSRDYASAPAPLRFDLGIQGYEATGTNVGNSLAIDSNAANNGWAVGWTPALPASISGLNPAPRPGSDIMVVRYFGTEGVAVDAAALGAGGSVTFTVSTASPDFYTSNNLYGIGNCSQGNPGAAVFEAVATPASQTLAVGKGGQNQTGFLSAESFGAGSRIFPASAVLYYVADRAGIPSLYRTTLGAGGVWGTPTVLVEGVETMQLTYGQDNGTADTNGTIRPDGNIDTYSTAANISGATIDPKNWRQVASVKVGLLLRSPERAAQSRAAGRGLIVNGVSIDETRNSKLILHEAYESTVALRNRLFGN